MNDQRSSNVGLSASFLEAISVVWDRVVPCGRQTLLKFAKVTGNIKH